MPIGLANFPILTPEQANPIGYGFHQGADIARIIADAQMQRMNAQKAQAELPFAGKMAEATAAYKAAMANYLSSPNQSLRHLSALGKTYIEPAVVQSIIQAQKAGNLVPSQGYNYQPPAENNSYGASGEDNQESLPDTYGLQRQKMSTDTDTRKRNLFARNVDITTSKIDPDDLFRYSGLLNQPEKFNELRKDMQGKPTQQWKDYQKALQNANLLSKQVRQFYGASITPEMDAQLKSLSNPESWMRSPETAKAMYGAFVDVLNSETQTYRDALKSPKAYQKSGFENAGNISRAMGGTQSAGIPKDWIMMRDTEGKMQMVHPEDVREAESQGWSRNMSRNVKGYR